MMHLFSIMLGINLFLYRRSCSCWFYTENMWLKPHSTVISFYREQTKWKPPALYVQSDNTAVTLWWLYCVKVVSEWSLYKLMHIFLLVVWMFFKCYNNEMDRQNDIKIYQYNSTQTIISPSFSFYSIILFELHLKAVQFTESMNAIGRGPY